MEFETTFEMELYNICKKQEKLISQISKTRDKWENMYINLREKYCNLVDKYNRNIVTN